MSSRILVLDFGSQYNQLIVRRIRQLGVFAELKRADLPIEDIKAWNPTAIILSGGPSSVYDEHSPRPAEGLFDLDLPILGICYGMQLMTHLLGGKIEASNEREYGKALLQMESQIESQNNCALTQNLKLHESQVWMSHGDSVKAIPSDFETIASTSSTPHTIVQHITRPLYGLQFHPEVRHSILGEELLKRFVFDICKCDATWTMASYLDSSLERIREQVGDSDRVILGLSGGVDSSVMALLLDKALGKRVRCLFIDNGLLRLNEGDQVEKIFRDTYDLDFVRINAEEIFLSRLKGVSDPEKKRKIIGNTFVEVFEDAVKDQTDVKWLAQGTIYPDVIESTSTHGASVTIKSHHNVGGLPEDMNLKILEPLRELFKDEVRKLGAELGLPHELLWRHPFPGPGLAVRVPGEVTKERCDVLRKADNIFIEEIRKAGIYDEIAQAFVVHLPVNTVGVMGDGRTYEAVVALRAVTTEDFMTADWYDFDHDFLARVSNRIVGEVRGVNRVVYDITSKPPGTIEWE
jgi:GMP synthase (glutamine-hydrolysing)